MTKVVLFDAVGTLFGVRGSVGEIYSALALESGVQANPREIEARFHQVFRQRTPPTSQARAWWHQTVLETFAGFDFADFEGYFNQVWKYFASDQAWELYPETVEVLMALRTQGVVLAIVSNFDERLHPVLEALAIRSYFSVVAVSTEVGAAKPDPRLFEFALRQLGVSADQAWHVGDAHEDVVGAEAAGIRALHLRRQGADTAGCISSLRGVLA
ncbi:MAG: HAD-IA family hydrolase [Gemmatimonadaceae bacterium]|nr:HAD-IA family hydrolase [Gloeobacterales cyanobacterium ES-bin-141]